MSVLTLICLFPLFAIIYQDFRYRTIMWFLPPILLCLLIVDSIQYTTLNKIVLDFGINLFFIIVNILLVSIYFSLKYRRLINIFKAHLGIGDLLFFIAIAPAFSPFDFAFFFVGSLIVLTLIQLVRLGFNSDSIKNSIPLAGWLAIFFTGVLFSKLVWGQQKLFSEFFFDQIL